MTNKKNMRVVYVTWGILALFFAYQYFLRVGPSVMMEPLRQEFELGAIKFAFMTALFAYAYGLLQIPMGLFLDHFGVRKTALISISLCTTGALTFYSALSYEMMCMGRVLMGVGAASGLISALKLVGDAIPKNYQGTLMGLTLGLGTVGALIAGKPQSYLMDVYGWRQAGLISAMGGLVLVVAAILFIPKNMNQHTPNSEKSEKNDTTQGVKTSLLKVIQSKAILVYALLAFGIFAPFAALSDTWGMGFLMTKYALKSTEAAECIGFVFIGLSVGSIVVPAFFERIKSLKLGLQMGIAFMGICGAIIVYAPNLTPLYLKILLFIFGFSSGAEMICFTFISSVAPLGARGLSLGYTNTINMVGSAVMMHTIGLLLDYFWGGSVSESGLRIYSAATYESAMSIIPVTYILTFCLSFFIYRVKE
ncbi:MAG: MFS transporter [Alphaproteobacteria bacterium]|nr:MFS transporter [Alphaproteobacteria bacterium]